jgi:hypothetical protein
MSGYLLSEYIDEDHCDTGRAKMMWLIIALATISSPILITIFDSCLREPIGNKKTNTKTTEDSEQAKREQWNEDDDVEGEFLNDQK